MPKQTGPKGIKKKVWAWLMEDPERHVYRRDIERKYIEFGGNCYPKGHRREGRVNWDTITKFVDHLPLKMVRKKENGRNSKFDIFAWDPVQAEYACYDKDMRPYRQQKLPIP